VCGLIEATIITVLTVLLAILMLSILKAEQVEQDGVFRKLILVILTSIFLLIIIGAYFSAFILASILVWVIKHGQR